MKLRSFGALPHLDRPGWLPSNDIQPAAARGVTPPAAPNASGPSPLLSPAAGGRRNGRTCRPRRASWLQVFATSLWGRRRGGRGARRAAASARAAAKSTTRWVRGAMWDWDVLRRLRGADFLHAFAQACSIACCARGRPRWHFPPLQATTTTCAAGPAPPTSATGASHASADWF